MREQSGYIWKRNGAWYGRWYENVLAKDGQLIKKQKSRKLCEVSDRYRFEKDVRKVFREQILDRLNEQQSNQALTGTPSGNMLLTEFTEEVYFPAMEKEKHPSTVNGYKDKWRNHVKPYVADLWLWDVQSFHVNQILNRAAREHNLSASSIARVKALLSAIFSFALANGHRTGNHPVYKVTLPGNLRGKKKTGFYTFEEIKGLMAILPQPASTIVALAGFSGLRKSELTGLEWGDYDGKTIAVNRAIWNGKVSSTKTEGSAASVPVIPLLRDILDAWKQSQGNPSKGPIFPNKVGNALDLNNVMARWIRPVLNACSKCGKQENEHDAKSGHKYVRNEALPVWKGWHAFRRSLATNLHNLGISDFVIRDIMRHDDVETTRKCYVKTVPKQSVDAMEQFQTALEKAGIGRGFRA